MVIFYKKWKKYNEIQLTKNKMDLNNRKMTNHPPSPDRTYNSSTTTWRAVQDEHSSIYQLTDLIDLHVYFLQ